MAQPIVAAVPERISKDLEGLAQYAPPGPGCSRTLFSDAYQDSRSWVHQRMQDAGLDVTTDAAGNILGSLQGRDPTLSAILIGSHTDTVRNGGNFDGIVGVLGAIEMIRALRESGITPRHTIRIVDFLGEESNDHGLTCLGSRSLAGYLAPADLDRPDSRGVSLGDRCTSIGLEPAAMVNRKSRELQNVGAYLELHIEQGPVLEQHGIDIGVVTAISGIERLVARYIGRADHAGSTPMADRRDALAAAASTVLAVRQLGCDSNGVGVATASRITVEPGSPNVVPHAARLEAEIRSTNPIWLDRGQRSLTQEITQATAEFGVEVDISWTHDNDAQPLSATLQSVIIDAAESLGHTWKPIPSGATHDAVHIAKRVPSAMLFVPSIEGRSHCPEEMTDITDITNGVNVLSEAIIRMDGRVARPA